MKVASQSRLSFGAKQPCCFFSDICFVNTCLSCRGGCRRARCHAHTLWFALKNLMLRSARARRILKGSELDPRWVTTWDPTPEERLASQPQGPGQKHPEVPAAAGRSSPTSCLLSSPCPAWGTSRDACDHVFIYNSITIQHCQVPLGRCFHV